MSDRLTQKQCFKLLNNCHFQLILLELLICQNHLKGKVAHVSVQGQDGTTSASLWARKTPVDMQIITAVLDSNKNVFPLTERNINTWTTRYNFRSLLWVGRIACNEMFFFHMLLWKQNYWFSKCETTLIAGQLPVNNWLLQSSMQSSVHLAWQMHYMTFLKVR